MKFSAALKAWLIIPAAIAVFSALIIWFNGLQKSPMGLFVAGALALTGLASLIAGSYAAVRLFEEPILRIRSNFIVAAVGALPGLHLAFWVFLGLVNLALRHEA
jgi:hypothetical protein